MLRVRVHTKQKQWTRSRRVRKKKKKSYTDTEGTDELTRKIGRNVRNWKNGLLIVFFGRFHSNRPSSLKMELNSRWLGPELLSLLLQIK